MKNLKTVDPKIYQLIKEEEKRQEETLMMIPSENYAPRAVREAVGSILTNKYSEGQIGKRYYQGNKIIDQVETFCKERALKVFKLDPNEWGVNVQPYSGTPANLAVYTALLKPGDRIMPMYLPEGGHISHGWIFKGEKVSLTSKVWNVEFYHVERESRVFDYRQVEKQAEKFRPHLLISGGTAYPREIDHQAMRRIAKKLGAYYLADVAHEAGLIAGGANSSPFPYADVVTMTTHKTLRGPRGAMIFSRKELSAKIDKAVFPGLQGGPHNHTIAGIAVALELAQQKSFKKYAHQVVRNAQVLAEELLKAGYDVVSGGTDKHLVLVDLRSVGLSGWIVAWALEYAGIVVNRNTVPYETASPYFPSGIRLGTPALTTRGMKEREMKKIAVWIEEVIEEVSGYKIPEDKEEKERFLKKTQQDFSQNKKLLGIAQEVKTFCQEFPVP